jgi:hypothetical protein
MDQWSSQHFSLANPIDDGSTDLPKLLRRIADAIEERDIEPMEILDLTVAQEMTEDGPWWSVTLYWSADGDAACSTGRPMHRGHIRGRLAGLRSSRDPRLRPCPGLRPASARTVRVS